MICSAVHVIRYNYFCSLENGNHKSKVDGSGGVTALRIPTYITLKCKRIHSINLICTDEEANRQTDKCNTKGKLGVA